MMRNRMFLFQKPVPRKPILQGTAGNVIVAKLTPNCKIPLRENRHYKEKPVGECAVRRMAPIHSNSVTEKRRISVFSRREIHPELKRQKYAMMKLWLAALGNAVFFRERDDGDGRDGLFESGERRERPSRRR